MSKATNTVLLVTYNGLVDDGAVGCEINVLGVYATYEAAYKAIDNQSQNVLPEHRDYFIDECRILPLKLGKTEQVCRCEFPTRYTSMPLGGYTEY